MTDLYKQIAGLSSEKRKLFDLYLKQEGVTLSELMIVAQGRDSDHFPLSFAQQRLWFLDQLEPGNPLYNNPAAIRLHGPLNLTALEQTLNEIIRRHEILRATFAMVDGQPVQTIVPNLHLAFPVVNLQGMPDPEGEAMRLATEEARRPFNLSEWPLLRVKLLKLAEEEHVVLLTMHHIVSDGWSVAVLIREVAALYEAFTRGAPATLPELPIQYVDFAVWQRQWLKGEKLDEQLAYWKRHLDGAAPTLELPADRPRPAAQTYRGATRFFNLPTPLCAALKELSRQNDATLFMTLLAAFQTLLYRYSGQEDFCVGSPVANRNRAETEELIGFFVNTLALRCDLSGDPSFRELLKRVRETALGALAHQDLPFEMLVEELQPERNRSHTPLFQVIFDLNNAAPNTMGALELPNLKAEALQVEAGVAHADLVLNMMEDGGALRGKFRYNTDIFDAATIERMLEHFQILLNSIVADPSQSISTLPLLAETERHQLLHEWNKPEASYSKSLSLHQWFETQVERTPDNVAVVFEGKPLSYRELNARANQLAHHLRRLGVGPDVLVGMYLERSLEMVVGILGILKAGGAYVPMDTVYPKERLAFMLEDSEAPVLLTQQPLLANLPEHKARVICLDADWEKVAEESEENISVEMTADALAYVIYTSGSTGKPKGALVTHYNVVRLFQSTQSWFNFDERDVWTLFHSYAFDFSVWELWGALLYGGRLVIVPYWLSRSPEAFHELLSREQVTVLNQTPSAFRQLIQAEQKSEIARELALRLVIFGGEALELQSLKPWFDRHGDARPQLVNMYGITETTVHVSYRPISAADLDQARGSVIGRAIPDLQIYILDQRRQPAPIGVPGEMYVGGAGVARGYLRRPELSAERFIADPFNKHLVNNHLQRLSNECSVLPQRDSVWSAASPRRFALEASQSGEDSPHSKRSAPLNTQLETAIEARLYKTGDLARYLPDGDIEYLGRIDQQVKIRGFRIELGEIEAALNRHPSVRESVVLVREDSPGDKRLVAYLAHEPGNVIPVDDLRRFLQQKLPDYMTPAAFVTLDTLPLTSNGKIDRRALPAPEQSRPELAEAFVAPRNPVEELLAGIWTDVLEIERVGVHDNFFDLGGHSLLATKLFSRIRDTFQVELPLADLFDSSTVAALAERIELAKREAQGPSLPPLMPVARPVAREDGYLPLSYTQQRLWFLDQLEPGSSAYNIPAAVRLTGMLDTEAIAQSFNEIVRRHESLRATFVTVNGQPAQLIASAQTLNLPVMDLCGLPETERESEAMRMAAEEARQSFDLARGPLLRLRLLKLGGEEHIALMTMHHIISDGWSIGILIREFAALYEAFTAGRPSPLPDLPIQYSDFAIWQQEWLQGEALGTQLAYWKRQLAGLTALELPTDRPRPPVQTFRGAWQSLLLSAEQAESLKALSRREGVTLFMTLLAAFQTLLHHDTNQDDIVVGADIANRNRRETEDLIGFFVNQLVLRTDLSGNPTFRELLGRVREMTLKAFAHQDTPFGKLVEELQPQRDMSRNPLFQVMFIVQNAPMPALKLPGLTLTPLDIKEETSVFDLTLSFVEAEQGQTRVLCRYNTDLFESATIARMLERLKALLNRVVERPGARLSALNIQAEAEAMRQEAEITGRPGSMDAKLKRLMSVKPRAVSMSQEKLVKLSYFHPERMLPLVAQPDTDAVDLITWAGTNKELIEGQLLKHGAILFRGFGVTSITKFERFTRVISPELMQYGERSSPRHKVSESVYTSTDHPADQPIVLHNEQSYTLSWMMKLWFFCLQPAQQGGATPIADSRRIFGRLSPKLVEKFEDKQVMYLRNYGAGLGLPWQEVFQTSEKSGVEEYCRQAGIRYEWLDGERLRTRQVRPAIRRHPKTDEKVWFNHALFFHVSSLEAATRDSLLAGLKEDDLPFNTYYGDGSPFEASALDEIREAYQRETVSFPWQAGDILMVDNMLVAHGREPFTGQRQVVVAMAEPFNAGKALGAHVSN
ncbi:MAG: amino acid adenylation domain-containing protein [Blastocatellales bacterium]